MLANEANLGPTDSGDTGITARLLEVVRNLVGELHPAPSRSPEVRLESSLDLDLGPDSLSRAELLARLDRVFGVRLPEQLLGEAETPADLLRAILATSGETREASIVRRLPSVGLPVTTGLLLLTGMQATGESFIHGDVR